MPDFDPELRRQAIVLFRRGMKANSVGVHRTLNRPPRGKGWVPGCNMAAAVAFFAVQVAISGAWFARFRYGPLEWWWRAVTYARVPPLRLSND